MSITVNLSEKELLQLKQLTHEDDEAEAVVTAAREFLRLAYLKQLKSVSGKVDFEDQSKKTERLATVQPSETDPLITFKPTEITRP